MKEQRLKEAMEHINIKEEMQKSIIENLSEPEKGAKDSIRKIRQTAAAAAVLLTVILVSIPVQAKIQHLVKERMESVPKEELTTLSEMIQTQNTEADSFSRDYSKEESRRMNVLLEAYQNGTFPENELPMAAFADQVQKGMFCYAEDTGCFYFPDRELTDEELLEIIDFNYKRNYSLEQSDEVREFIAEQDKEWEDLKEQLPPCSVTEEEAADRAESCLESLFGESADGAQENSHPDQAAFTFPTYCVCFDYPNDRYYYFWIDMADGSLAGITLFHLNWLDAEAMTESQVPEQMEKAYPAALQFLEDKLLILEDYESVDCVYQVQDGTILKNRLWFYFLKEDGTGYYVDIFCDPAGNMAVFSEYGKTDKNAYQERISRDHQDLEMKSIPVNMKDRS